MKERAAWAVARVLAHEEKLTVFIVRDSVGEYGVSLRENDAEYEVRGVVNAPE